MTCKGMNCTSTDGKNHSPECRAEYAATVAGGRFVKWDSRLRVVPEEPTPEMIRVAVSFALSVGLSKEYTWGEYVSDIWRKMVSVGSIPTSRSVD